MKKILDHAHSTKISQTPAGSNAKLEQMGKAINEVFGLFRINFHNQYYKAYPNEEQLRTAKKLMLESLLHFPPETVVTAARRALQECEFLPTIYKMLTLCAVGSNGLPEARAAYREACNAPRNKSDYAWSHPAVYHAGRATDWFFLASNPEPVAYPVFAEHYKNICSRVLRGEKFQMPKRIKLEENLGQSLSKAENAERLAKLRAELKL